MPKLKARKQVAAWSAIYAAPCQAVCPIHTDARSYVTLVGQERFREAFARAREGNPLAGICGRACSAPCEDVCTRGEFDRPVRIRLLKRFLSDRFGTSAAPEMLPEPSGKRVAIIGGGPAGLTAAHDLARLGHAVTVYEAAAEPGGMATLGVPRFRLPLEVVRDDIREIEALGVEIKTGIRIGKRLSFTDLRREYDAVFVASGAARVNDLSIPGSGLQGVIQAIPYLTAANLGLRPPTGKRVAIIGGGYTAMDAARTAVRLGAEQAMVLYRRSRREMEVHDGELEATLREGADIQYLVSPLAVADDGQGRVAAIECIRNELAEPDESGRARPVPIAGSEFRLPADMVILAIGQTPDVAELGFEEGALLRTPDQETMMTDVEGVFSGGDFVSGPSTIIEAMRDGRIAARSIHLYLSGQTPAASGFRHGMEAWPLVLAERTPAPMDIGQPSQNGAGLLAMEGEVERGLTEEEAVREGLRCLSCGLLPRVIFEDCTLCRACVEVCPAACIVTVAVDERGEEFWPAGSHRDAASYYIDPEACIRCGRCYGVCPPGAIVV